MPYKPDTTEFCTKAVPPCIYFRLPSGDVLKAAVDGKSLFTQKPGNYIFWLDCTSDDSVTSLLNSIHLIDSAITRRRMHDLLQRNGSNPGLRLDNIRHFMTKQQGLYDAFHLNVTQMVAVILQSRGIDANGGIQSAQGERPRCSCCQEQMVDLDTLEPAPFTVCTGAEDTCGNCQWENHDCDMKMDI